MVFIFLPFADHSCLLFLGERVSVVKTALYLRLFGPAVLHLVFKVLLTVLFALFTTILNLCPLECILFKLTHPGHLSQFLALLKPFIDVFGQGLGRGRSLPLLLRFQLKGFAHFILISLHFSLDALLFVMLLHDVTKLAC